MRDAGRSLLRMIWLASPALPVGGFSYSDALESAIEAGLVRDEASAAGWLDDQLELALVRSEMGVVSEAFDAWSRDDAVRIAALNLWLLTTRETSEQRAQCEQMGRAMLQWLQNSPERADARIAQLGQLRPAPGWPIGFALAAALGGANRREALLAFAFGWAENMVQAALKAMPLGQSAGQRILNRLSHSIPDAADRAAAAAHDSQRQAFAPMLAILSSHHETQYSRLFRS